MWLRVGLGIAAALAAAFALHEIFKYTRMITHIFLSLVYKPEADYSTSRGEKIVILDSADQEIEALFAERPGARKVLIFCHESGSGKESWEKYADFFPVLGFHVLSLDFRKAPRHTDANELLQWPSEQQVERLVTVIRWAKRALAPTEGVLLFGVSNGADLAFAASFRHPAVRAIIADGLFSMKEIFRDYIRRWAPVLVRPNLFGEYYPAWVVNLFTELGFWYCQKKSKTRFVDVERLLNRKHVPLLMIHGERDDYISESHQRFLERMNHRQCVARRFSVPQAGHNESVMIAKTLYEEEIKNFIAQVK